MLEAVRLTTVAERVEWVTDLLASGTYEHRVTDASLARIWGITRGSVGNYLGEAWRHLAMDHSPERSEEIRAEMLASIRMIRDRALNRTKEICNVKGDIVQVSDPDCRTALQAIVEMATLMSIREERHRMSVDVTKLSEEQILSQLADQGYVLSKPAPVVLLTEGEERE